MDVIIIKDKKLKSKRIINLILKTDKKFILISVISSLILSTIPLLSINLMQQIINLLQIGDKNIEKIFFIVLLYLFVNLLLSVIETFLNYYNTKFGLKFNLYLDNLILNKASHLSLKDFENSDVYDKFNRAQEDINNKIILMINTLIKLITLLITTILYIVKFISFNILIIPFIIIVPAIKYFVTNKFNIKQYNIIRNRTNENRKAWYYSYLITNGDAFKELKINDLFSYFIKKYNTYISKFNKQDLTLEKERLIKISLLNLLEEFIDGILFTIIIFSGITKVILIGDVITYTKLIMNIKDNIKNILSSLSILKQNSLYIDMLFELLDMKNENEFQLKTSLLKIDSIEKIEFKNVFFKYKKEQDYILKNINLVLEKGTSFAIVGLNGSGKTTLGKLMMGYYFDYEGEILINGTSIKNIDMNSYRNKIGFLFQDFLKFEATLRENIYYGNLSLINDDMNLEKIINKFDLNKILEGENDKYDTQLGYWFDSGKQISIGQWHRVALSRTFVKNADVYLLDEPNSSLDPFTENRLSNLYSEVFENKIGIIITHRFINIVKKVDEIIVIDNGNIIEKGTHEHLLHTGTLYSKLYKIQLEGEVSNGEF
ncbi:ABC transporter ATP-binding protein/permease [Clostridioides difficile]|uniref:ATP-binding cassette domain-containing protein n=1 Tax=Clostridioides difficile TaxID=1496 RepID=UPI0020C2F921|nr:ABC transporter ATP-binding protein [Clostridioides difficile]MCP8382601.1 ABC transporter ATP-binding protein/permease [Clostridioides difficile]